MLKDGESRRKPEESGNGQRRLEKARELWRRVEGTEEGPKGRRNPEEVGEEQRRLKDE